MRDEYKNIFSNFRTAQEAAEGLSSKDLAMWAFDVTRARRFDIEDYDDLVTTRPYVYRTNPASSSDLIGTEKVGDISADSTYLYVVVDNGGTLEWRRVAISSF